MSDGKNLAAERQAKIDEWALAIVGGPMVIELARLTAYGTELRLGPLTSLVYDLAEAMIAESERRAKTGSP